MTSVTIRDEADFVLTKKGKAEISDGYTLLSSFALELLVRIDGGAHVAQLRAGMPEVPFAQIADALQSLLRSRMITSGCRSTGDVLRLDNVKGLARPIGVTQKGVSSEAKDGLSTLKQHGYYVRIARRRDALPTLPTGRKPRVVVVEDEPHLAKFVKHFMAFEGFDACVASNRIEIVQALREPPLPDLVLLDVVLPDANGFEVLTKIRQHPALSAVPVLMLTGEATRESVIKGLTCGADGYVTKPFQTDVLLNAIRTLFGLAHNRECPWSYV